MALTGRATSLARYLLDPRRDIELFGMYGAANLGDEAMEDAGLAVLPPARTVSTASETRSALVNGLMKERRRKHFVLGGGTLVHGGDTVAGNAWLDLAERRLGQGSQVALFGTGISFKPEQISSGSRDFRRWSKILQQAEMVGVRGPISQAYARDMGVEAACFGDAVFSLYDASLVVAERDRTKIGFNFGECLGDQDHYEQVNARLLQQLPAGSHCAIFIVHPGDRDSTARIISASGLASDRYTVIEEFWDPRRYMKLVADCHAFVGVKLHASGLALVAGVPALLFQYKEKCRDLYSTLDLQNALIDLEMNTDQVIQMFEHLLAQPEDFSNVARIAEYQQSQKQTVTTYFQDR